MAAEVSDTSSLYRIFVAGNPGVGKRTLIDKFGELGAGGNCHPTKAGDSKIASVELGGRKFQVHFVCRRSIHSCLSLPTLLFVE